MRAVLGLHLRLGNKKQAGVRAAYVPASQPFSVLIFESHNGGSNPGPFRYEWAPCVCNITASYRVHVVDHFDILIFQTLLIFNLLSSLQAFIRA
jgi:hypothetical protein